MKLADAAGLAFVLWAATLGVALSWNGDVTAYVLLVTVGLLATREVLGSYTPRTLTTRLGAFVFAGLVATAFIVAVRVWNLLTP